MSGVKIDLVIANTTEDFVTVLNERVEQGWAPQGSPFIFEERINIMILKIPEEDLAARI